MDNILELLKDIKKFFNFSVAIIGLAALTFIIDVLKQPNSFLCVDHLKDVNSLIVKLRNGRDPLSRYLKEKFSKETKERLDRYKGSTPPSKLLKSELIGELNKQLKDQSLYDKQRFEQVIFTDRTKKLINQNPKKEKDVRRLNRLLLEEAYQHEIAMLKEKRKPIKIFNLEIYREYFSLVYGILFGVFILILFLKLYLLKIILDQKHLSNYDSIRFFPWVASPFHKSKIGLFIFIGVIIIGFSELGIVTYGHIWGSLPEEEIMSPWIYRRLIGGFDVFVLFVGFILCIFILKCILNIKQILRSVT